MAIPTVFRDPARPPRRIRPFKALAHFRKLVADKEDTEQVFHISEALPNRGYLESARRFCSSAHGKSLMKIEPFLPAILDDHETLLAMPEGSVAHAYVAFMKREGLSAAGLVAESEKMHSKRPRYADQFAWFGNRLRDTHDLVHVLTGYGRDALGEQCALGFSYGQYWSLTDRFLSWAGAFELWRRKWTRGPVFAAVAQAERHGKAAGRIYEQDIRALLAEPLDAARARLGIGKPDRYRAAHASYRARGIDPYTFLAAAPA